MSSRVVFGVWGFGSSRVVTGRHGSSRVVTGRSLALQDPQADEARRGASDARARAERTGELHRRRAGQALSGDVRDKLDGGGEGHDTHTAVCGVRLAVRTGHRHGGDGKHSCLR